VIGLAPSAPSGKCRPQGSPAPEVKIPADNPTSAAAPSFDNRG
jgi:hypothetical protein